MATMTWEKWFEWLKTFKTPTISPTAGNMTRRVHSRSTSRTASRTRRRCRTTSSRERFSPTRSSAIQRQHAGEKSGSDSIGGFDGNDTLYGDAYSLLGQAEAGDDKLFGQNDDDKLYGDAWMVGAQAKGGHDHLSGGPGVDTLYGDACSLIGKGGNDYIEGNDGSDTLYGDGSGFSASSIGGNDKLVGGAGATPCTATPRPSRRAPRAAPTGSPAAGATTS